MPDDGLGGVAQAYSLADVEAAIETANHHYFGQFLRVRDDVTNTEFAGGGQSGDDDYRYRGAGSDVGHGFRHVDGTATAGKSTYADKQTMYRAVQFLLNSNTGQRELAQLDSNNPLGDEMGYNGNAAVTATVSQSVQALNLYGKDQAGNNRKIKRAMCIVQKLGAKHLWVHTTYPTSFV